MMAAPRLRAVLALALAAHGTGTGAAAGESQSLRASVRAVLHEGVRTTPSPSAYVSPYSYVAAATSPSVAGDLLQGPKAPSNYQNWSPTPFADWQDFDAIQALHSTWGPDYVKFPNEVDSPTQTLQWQQYRLVAASNIILGTVPYAHHHMHVWNVPNTPQWVNANYTPGVGIDCSDYSHYNYLFGLGVDLNSGVVTQSGQVQADMYLAGNAEPVSVVGQILFDVQSGYEKTYEGLMSQLQPGDLLYIRGDPALSNPITHVIMFLGNLAVDANGQDQYLVTDSHGDVVLDSNGNTIPSGPRIRPLREDSYYYSSFDHVVRWLPLVQAAGG